MYLVAPIVVFPGTEYSPLRSDTQQRPPRGLHAPGLDLLVDMKVSSLHCPVLELMILKLPVAGKPAHSPNRSVVAVVALASGGGVEEKAHGRG